MKRVPTYWVELYLSGPIEVAKQYLRAECARQGLCATITPTLYIYTGGEESGYVVRLIQYPRFPIPRMKVYLRAVGIAHALLELTHQASLTLMTPKTTRYIESKRIKK